MTRIKIESMGPILPGSISSAYSKCGNPSCRCQKNKKDLHGPYFRWTGFIDGKRTTKTIDKKTALECKRRIKNYQELKLQFDELVKLATKNAPWSNPP